MLLHFQSTNTFTKPFRKIVKLTREALLIFNSSYSTVTTPQVSASDLMKHSKNLPSIIVARLKQNARYILFFLSCSLSPFILLLFFFWAN